MGRRFASRPAATLGKRQDRFGFFINVSPAVIDCCDIMGCVAIDYDVDIAFSATVRIPLGRQRLKKTALPSPRVTC